MDRIINILHNPLAQFLGGHAIEVQILRHIHEGLIHGIHVDILLRDVLQIDAINLRGIIQVLLHPRRRHNIINALRNLEDATAVMDTKCLHRRRDCQANGLIRSCWICNNQPCGHRIQSPLRALHRGIEGF